MDGATDAPPAALATVGELKLDARGRLIDPNTGKVARAGVLITLAPTMDDERYEQEKKIRDRGVVVVADHKGRPVDLEVKQLRREICKRMAAKIVDAMFDE